MADNDKKRRKDNKSSSGPVANQAQHEDQTGGANTRDAQPKTPPDAPANENTQGSWWSPLVAFIERKRQSANAKIILAVVIIVALFIVKRLFWPGDPSPAGGTLFIDVLTFLFLIILFFFVYLFTKPLPGLEAEQRQPDETVETRAANLERRDQERRDFARLKQYWMFLAYSFMVLALAATVYPFTVDLLWDEHEKGFKKQQSRTLDSPIGVFLGCTTDIGAEALPLHCFGNAPQANASASDPRDKEPRLSWVLQIGGYVAPFSQERSAKSAAPLQKTETGAEPTPIPTATPTPESTGTPTPVATPTPAPKGPTESNNGSATPNTISNWRNNGYSVSGGLIIPFYLIVLSLVGGAVSLTRRIPEYQKQAAPGYVGTDTAPVLTPPMLREYLVFQIIQFISAPFIATVAYYVIEPGTTSATVGLAFAAGFASESVLLWVRAIVDKLRPESKPAVPTGSLAGTIPILNERSASEAEKTTTVTIVGNANLVPTFSDAGQFVIHDVPAGAQALEVNYRPGDPEQEQSWCQRIQIQAGKTVPVRVEPPRPGQHQQPPADAQGEANGND